MKGLDKAIEMLGGLTALGRLLGETKAAVYQWRVRGKVPAPHCPEIEKLCGGEVLCEELNDDVDWSWVRKSGDRRRKKRVPPAGRRVFD